MSYVEKTESLRHQADVFEFSKDLTQYALFWAQGVGKTKPTIDKFGYLFTKGKVEAMFVVAPPNVAPNWVNDELPKHLPDSLLKKAHVLLYRSSKAKQKRAIAERAALLRHTGGPRILVMSFPAMRTKMGKAYARKFMLKYRTFGVVDESQRIKSPSGKTQKTVVASGAYLPYKQILSGTPITKTAFDVYTQIKFLDPDFWKERELEPYSVFKKHFGIWKTRAEVEAETGWDPGYDQLLGHKNIEELKGYIQMIGHRLTKETAGIKLPPKVYTRRYFDLSPEQMRCYIELEEDLTTQLPLTGDIVEVLDKIVLGMRHAQITCGYIAAEAGDPVQRIDETNPRLECFKQTVEDLGEGKAIVWCRFTQDIEYVMETLTQMGRKPVRYDGQVSFDQREINKKLFQEGDATDFVAKQQSAAAGVTLHAAEFVHYYSQSYNWEHRAQSEDRAHRVGLDHSVLYIDYIANDTIDGAIIKSLLKTHRLAQELLGDEKTDWIAQ